MRLCILCATTLFLCLQGCEDFGYVEKAKYEELQKQLSTTRDQLAKAQQQLNDLQVHRYEVHHLGYRTWRLDTVKGSTCVLLTTQSDWKNPDTQSQSCQCEDYWKSEKPDLEIAKAMGCIGK